MPITSGAGQRLAALAGSSASDAGYNAIIDCADAINNGIGIGETCDVESAE